jgi:signal peptidase I
MVFALRCVALGVLVALVACTAAAPAKPVTPRAAPRVQAPPPTVTSTFAAHAPDHTRLLLAMDMAAVLESSQVQALALLVPKCDLDLEHQVQRVEIAWGEPADIRIDLTGTLSVETARCVLDALKERGLRLESEITVAPLAHGVRIATPRALADGQDASSELTRRFDALASHSKDVLVADLAPGGNYELWTDDAGSLTLRTALRSSEQAAAAATWTKGALTAAPNAELADIAVTAEGSALTLRLPDATERRAPALRRHLLESFRNPSGSMLPTLSPGDHLFALKGPLATTPERGDIVVFASPREPSLDYVKRVIGVAGDHIEIDGYHVRLNGKELETVLDTANYVPPVADAPSGELWRETLANHEYVTLRDAAGSSGEALDVTVEPGCVFLLGDNRDNSMDSRQFGSVSQSSIKGRVALIWASFGETRVAWERFGLEPH